MTTLPQGHRDESEIADDDFLRSAYVNLLTEAAARGGRVPLYFLSSVLVAQAYEVRALREELRDVTGQLKEIDSTLVGSFDDLIAIGRDVTRAIDRLLGSSGK